MKCPVCKGKGKLEEPVTSEEKGDKMKKKWTKKQLCKHIRKNSENTYSMAVELSTLYLKLYGELPKGIGLSGQQAEFAKSIVHKLPNRCVNDLYL